MRERWLRRMMPIIFRLMTAKRQICQGRKVLRKSVQRVGLVTYWVFSSSMRLLRDEAPAGAEARLVEEEVVEQES